MKKSAQKTLYAMVGAPVVVRRRLSDVSTKVVDNAKREFNQWAKEGEKVAKDVRSSDVVEEISARVDVDQIQGQVERLRDQLEGALTNWKDNFRPETAAAPKATTKKAPARKPAAKKAPAAKATAKKATAKKAPARKPAAKKTPAAKATAKKAPARKPAAKKAPAKTTSN